MGRYRKKAESGRTGQKWAGTNRTVQELGGRGKVWRDAAGQKRNRARWGWAGRECDGVEDPTG